MKLIQRKLLTSAALLLAFATVLAGCKTAPAPKAAAPLTPDSARQLAVEAYVYGYPLVTMEFTRRVMTNMREVQGTRGPMGHLIKLRAYPTAAFRDVTAPNADTLYTTAWLDVGKEPWIMKVPDFKGRYYLLPLLDGWTDVFEVPGKRTTGTGPQTYAITGPGWKGSLPAGVKELKSPTALVWLLGRIYCTGTPEDYAAVHQLQDEISIAPLSAYGKPYTPPPGKVDASLDMKTAVREQVNALSVDEYFNLLASLMKENPPKAADKPMLVKLAQLGIRPGERFDSGKEGPAVKAALSTVPKIANEKIMLWMKDGIAAGDSKFENGWIFTTKTGTYGVNYIQRALVTAIGLGANRPQDAIYPTSEGPALGESYTGAKKYVMHFPKGQLPPAEGFWSVTMYDKDYFFVQNSINRQSISARQNLKQNADGSVDLYIQNENPGADKESNWLPAPKDKFILMMRLYWAKTTPPSILDGSWVVPAVKAVE